MEAPNFDRFAIDPDETKQATPSAWDRGVEAIRKRRAGRSMPSLGRAPTLARLLDSPSWRGAIAAKTGELKTLTFWDRATRFTGELQWQEGPGYWKRREEIHEVYEVRHKSGARCFWWGPVEVTE